MEDLIAQLGYVAIFMRYTRAATSRDVFGRIVAMPADRLFRPMEILDANGNLAPVAFGTDWTEPAAGATVAGTTPWEIHWGGGNSFQGAATAVELLAATKYFFYPYYDLVTGLTLMACPTGVVPTALDGPSAQLQCADGHLPITNLGSMTATVATAGGTASGVSGSGQNLGGGGGRFL